MLWKCFASMLASCQHCAHTYRCWRFLSEWRGLCSVHLHLWKIKFLKSDLWATAYVVVTLQFLMDTSRILTNPWWPATIFQMIRAIKLYKNNYQAEWYEFTCLYFFFTYFLYEYHFFTLNCYTCDTGTALLSFSVYACKTLFSFSVLFCKVPYEVLCHNSMFPSK